MKGVWIVVFVYMLVLLIGSLFAAFVGFCVVGCLGFLGVQGGLVGGTCCSRKGSSNPK